MTIYDLRREWGPSDYDFKHLLALTSVYELPFGKGKPMNDRAVEAAATGTQEFPKDLRFKKLLDELRTILERNSK